MTGDLLDDLFHGCAWVAFVEEARQQGGWPDVKATRQRAYDLYEAALAVRNANRPAAAGRADPAGTADPDRAADPLASETAA